MVVPENGQAFDLGRSWRPLPALLDFAVFVPAGNLAWLGRAGMGASNLSADQDE
jgi:hypothetical protein